MSDSRSGLSEIAIFILIVLGVAVYRQYEARRDLARICELLSADVVEARWSHTSWAASRADALKEIYRICPP